MLPSIDPSASAQLRKNPQIHKFAVHDRGTCSDGTAYRAAPKKEGYYNAPLTNQEGFLAVIFIRRQEPTQMIFKRGHTYWYKFNSSIKQRDGSSKFFLIRRSARTKISIEAEEVEHEHRRAIRLGEIHPLDPWPKPPTPEARLLREFSTRFLECARLHVKDSSVAFYTAAVSRLLAFPELASEQISKIKPEVIARFANARRSRGVGVCAINGDLRTLRRLLRLAFEWELIPRSPVVHALPGERTRDRVISFEEEQKYLAAAGSNLRALTILAVDTGMRAVLRESCP